MVDFILNFDDDDRTSNKASGSGASSRLSLFRKPLTKEMLSDHSISENYKNIRVKMSDNGSPIRKFEANSPNIVRRKFPGPAGLLPDIKSPQIFNDSSITLDLAEEKNSSEEPLFCSQTFLNVFEDPPYRRLKKDFDLDREGSSLKPISVQLVKCKKLRRRKIPFLALVLDCIDKVDPNGAVLKLRDPTGDIKGVIPSELWKEMEQELKSGTALVLKDVGVINYINCLNITKPNIVAVYTPESDGDVAIKTKQVTDSADLARQVAEWQAKADEPSTPAHSPHSLLADNNPPVNLFQLNSPKINTKTPQAKRPSASRQAACGSIPKQFRLDAAPISNDLGSALPPANYALLMDDDDDFANVDLDFDTTTSNQSSNSTAGSNKRANTSALSQEETSMVNEVLADFDFDDF